MSPVSWVLRVCQDSWTVAGSLNRRNCWTRKGYSTKGFEDFSCSRQEESIACMKVQSKRSPSWSDGDAALRRYEILLDKLSRGWLCRSEWSKVPLEAEEFEDEDVCLDVGQQQNDPNQLESFPPWWDHELWLVSQVGAHGCRLHLQSAKWLNVTENAVAWSILWKHEPPAHFVRLEWFEGGQVQSIPKSVVGVQLAPVSAPTGLEAGQQFDQEDSMLCLVPLGTERSEALCIEGLPRCRWHPLFEEICPNPRAPPARSRVKLKAARQPHGHVRLMWPQEWSTVGAWSTRLSDPKPESR